MNSTSPKGTVFPKTLNAIVNASELSCAIPHCPNTANEWHHVTSIKREKRKNKRAIEIAYRTRQIPVCFAHHKLITYGKYDGPSLRKLPAYDAGTVLSRKEIKS